MDVMTIKILRRLGAAVKDSKSTKKYAHGIAIRDNVACVTDGNCMLLYLPKVGINLGKDRVLELELGEHQLNIKNFPQWANLGQGLLNVETYETTLINALKGMTLTPISPLVLGAKANGSLVITTKDCRDEAFNHCINLPLLKQFMQGIPGMTDCTWIRGHPELFVFTFERKDIGLYQIIISPMKKEPSG